MAGFVGGHTLCLRPRRHAAISANVSWLRPGGLPLGRLLRWPAHVRTSAFSLQANSCARHTVRVPTERVDGAPSMPYIVRNADCHRSLARRFTARNAVSRFTPLRMVVLSIKLSHVHTRDCTDSASEQSNRPSTLTSLCSTTSDHRSIGPLRGLYPTYRRSGTRAITLNLSLDRKRTKGS